MVFSAASSMSFRCFSSCSSAIEVWPYEAHKIMSRRDTCSLMSGSTRNAKSGHERIAPSSVSREFTTVPQIGHSACDSEPTICTPCYRIFESFRPESEGVQEFGLLGFKLFVGDHALCV